MLQHNTILAKFLKKWGPNSPYLCWIAALPKGLRMQSMHEEQKVQIRLPVQYLHIYAMHMASYTFSFAGKAHLATCKQEQIKPLVINIS
jgi:hypothetical protein